MKYITEYQPNLTAECLTYIGNNINPVFENDSTAIYSLNYVLEALNEELGQNNDEEIFGITKADIKELEKLENEKVDYIEF